MRWHMHALRQIPHTVQNVSNAVYICIALYTFTRLLESVLIRCHSFLTKLVRHESIRQDCFLFVHHELVVVEPRSSVAMQ